MKQCRVCGSDNTAKAGTVEYYTGHPYDIYTCCKCGCRFTDHDAGIHEWMHTQPESIYGIYLEQAAQCRKLFNRGDSKGLRDQLCQASKYRFVIETIDALGQDAKILEVGCSRGHLAAYFILTGRKLLAADKSAAAIQDAIKDFGNNFIKYDYAMLKQRGPYDVIYHVGTIGCVSSPAAMTRELLALLKPGGLLLFNAPNVDACCLEGQLWLDEAPPPDLVTLFKPGIWKTLFPECAGIDEKIENHVAERAKTINLKRICHYRWRKPVAINLEQSIGKYRGTKSGARRGIVDGCWHVFEKLIMRVSRVIDIPALNQLQPAPFGMFVKITR